MCKKDRAKIFERASKARDIIAEQKKVWCSCFKLLKVAICLNKRSTCFLRLQRTFSGFRCFCNPFFCIWVLQLPLQEISYDHSDEKSTTTEEALNPVKTEFSSYEFSKRSQALCWAPVLVWDNFCLSLDRYIVHPVPGLKQLKKHVIFIFELIAFFHEVWVPEWRFDTVVCRHDTSCNRVQPEVFRICFDFRKFWQRRLHHSQKGCHLFTAIVRIYRVFICSKETNLVQCSADRWEWTCFCSKGAETALSAHWFEADGGINFMQYIAATPTREAINEAPSCHFLKWATDVGMNYSITSSFFRFIEVREWYGTAPLSSRLAFHQEAKRNRSIAPSPQILWHFHLFYLQIPSEKSVAANFF